MTNWSVSISISQHRPDNFKRESFSFQKPCKPPPAGLPVKALHCIYFIPRNQFRGLELRFIDINLFKDLPDDLPVDPLVLEFLLDPAPAEPPKPDPAPRPLVCKLSIIHITETRQVVKNGSDYRDIKFPIMKFCLDLRPASRPVGEKTVGCIFSAGEFLVIHLTAPSPSLYPGDDGRTLA